MLIGEKPGFEESVHRPPTPFVGKSGRFLDQFLLAANLERESLYITNLVKEFTEYSKPTADEISRDHAELIGEIMDCNPEVIGLVGAYATEHVLMNGEVEMDRMHGTPFKVDSLFGGELDRDGGWTVLPMLHPAGAIHAPDSAPRILEDVLQLGRLLDGEIGVREIDPYIGKEDYRVVGVREMKSILPVNAHYPIKVAIDTEGSTRHPYSLQFSIKPGTGYLIRGYDKPSLLYFRNWVRRANVTVYMHNSLFDLGVLRSMGVELKDGSYRDTMLIAYNLVIESQALKPLAWRHCSAYQNEYQEIMDEASREKAMEYLCLVLARKWPDIEPILIQQGGKFRYKKPWGVEKRVTKIITDVLDDKRDKEGNPIDPRRRWKEIDDFVREPVESEIGPMPNATLDDIDPKVATNYACRDADISLRIAPILEGKIRDMELESISSIDHAILPMLDRMQHNGIRLAGVEFWDQIHKECEDQKNRATWAIYKATGVDLNPASGKQVAELLYGQLGLTPPKMTDSGDRGSVDGLCLESLLGENPVVQHIMDYNEANKIDGTYVRPLRKLCQIGDHRTRSTIRSTRTTTGRLAMADPPLHQIPILSDIGKKLRAGFIAEEGNVLGDWDVDQLEARVCAHDSRDEELCRLFNEGRDVHAETACRMFSVSMSQLSVGPTGKINDYRRSVAKHCIAEGQLVLTDQGLVPIEKITVQHKVWDGVEWVSHDGIVDQGIREVIEYDGIVATPDHQVIVEQEDGSAAVQTFGFAACSMGRIVLSGNEGSPLRTRYRSFLESAAQERIHRTEMQMHDLWRSELEDQGEFAQTWNEGVPSLQSQEIEIPESAGYSVRCNPSALQYSSLQGLRELWWTWDQMPVSVSGGIREVGRDQLAAQGLCGCDYRSRGQRWPLRARKLEIGYPTRADDESENYCVDEFPWETNKDDGLRYPLQLLMDRKTGSSGNERRGHYPERYPPNSERSSLQELASAGKVVKRSRVYDILNAGPRLCFTVSGKLVLNCFFGIINGITEKGLVNYMILNRCRRHDGSSWTEDDCVQLLTEWFKIYKGVKRFHLDCMEETRQTGIARESIGGRIIYLPQIWSPVKMVRESAERMSYVMYTQGGGQTIIKKAMAVAWKEVFRSVLFKNVEPLLQMHDELLWELPDQEQLKKDVDRIMVGALCETVKLRVPMKASGGYGPNWLTAH